MELGHRREAGGRGWPACEGLGTAGMVQQKSLRKGHSPPKLLGLLAAVSRIYLKHTRHFASFHFPAQTGLEPKASGTVPAPGPCMDHQAEPMKTLPHLRIACLSTPHISCLTTKLTACWSRSQRSLVSPTSTGEDSMSSFNLSSSLSESSCCSTATSALEMLKGSALTSGNTPDGDWRGLGWLDYSETEERA